MDGTLYTHEGAIPGAVEAIQAVRRRGIPVRFVTNTTRASRQAVVARLSSYGFDVGEHELFTPAVAAAAVLRERGARILAPFVASELLDDLVGFSLCGGVSATACAATPEAVLLGDLGESWTPGLLNQAFRYVMDGASLMALHKGRYWMGAEGLELDAGAYVAALEFATGREAVLCGKPLQRFFHSVLDSLGLHPPLASAQRPVMVGDDLWNDVGGAQQAGLAGWLVRTGKFRDDVLAENRVTPDRVIDSVANVI